MIYFCGESQSGKTHLLHAIGNSILQRKINIKFLLIHGKDLDTLSSPILTEGINFFLINDIDSVKTDRGKSLMVEFHMELYKISKNKRVIVTSKLLPTDNPIIQNQLKFQCEMSILAKIMPKKDLELELA